jgi:hypothetical protein
MRLLNVYAFAFCDSFGQTPPPYAIASPRWIARTEAMWEDVQERKELDTAGYRKVKGVLAYVRAYLPLVKRL